MSFSKRGTRPAKEPTVGDVTHVKQIASRNESEAGGVPLPPRIELDHVTPTTGASKRKRRPKKIANPPGNNNRPIDGSQAHLVTSLTEAPIGVEVEALKSKVKKIEAQVQEILLRPTSQGPPKSARRRTRHPKVKEQSTDIREDGMESSKTDKADLEKLQAELEDAQTELLSLKAKGKQPQGLYGSSQSLSKEKDDEVEEITRTHDPGYLGSQRPRPLGRAVTLSGSYRIPIPVSISDTDFDAISRGIQSAQTIARSFINASDGRLRRDEPASDRSNSWSEWVGGYSVSIAKAVDKVLITSNIESVPKRPSMIGRSETTPPARRRPTKLEKRSKGNDSMPKISRQLSDTQVAGLLA